MQELGNPQDAVRSIHIAGTSGKGSTAYYLSSLLMGHGFLTGTHVSPHVYDLRERTMINLRLQSKSDYVKNINTIIPVAARMSHKKIGMPTIFEVTVGEAFQSFANAKVDYAVIETGLGGRFDSTNTITRPDKLAVITSIGYDHMDVLGDTLEKIAFQKAGIIPVNGLAIVLSQQSSVNQVFSQVASERHATIVEVSPTAHIKNLSVSLSGIKFDYNDGDINIADVYLPTIGTYQAENASYAIAILKELAKRDNFLIDYDAIKASLAKCVIPGRCELISYDDKTVVLDGAHNVQKIEALTASISKLNSQQKYVWLLAHKKNIKEMTEVLLPMANKIIYTEFEKHLEYENQYQKSELVIVPENVGEADSNKTKIEYLSDSSAAIREAVKSADKEQLIIVTGSIYLLSDVRRSLIK